jgi:ATP-dependent Clp protease ATP-binding subunit ClpB
MLKPALARGELRCIGATTLNEYRKHIEKDAALERRFQPVFAWRALGRRHHRHPARPQGALRGAPRRPHPGRAIVAAATLSQPLHQRPLPAGQGHRPDRRGGVASCAWRSTRCPVPIDQVQRKVMQLEIERQALKKEKDDASKKRLELLESELADLNEQRSGHAGAVAFARRRPSPRSARRRRTWSSCASTSSAPSAWRTSTWRRACSTARSPRPRRP